MSKPTQPPAATGGKPAARALTGSKWALGPPQLSQPASATVSPLQSPNPNKEKLTTSDSATTSTPPSARQSQAGQPRKAATPAAPAASKAVNIPSPPTAASTPAKNPALNFGTVDNPESTISSSPATKPTAGAHLGEGEKVKSFGSVAAAAAAQSPAVAVSTPAPTSDKPAQVNGDKPAPPTEAAAAPAPAQTKPKFDPHKMFQKAPAATPSSAPSAPTAAPVSPAAAAPIALASPAPVPQQQNPYAQLQATQMQPGQAGIPHSRGYTAQGMPVQSFSPSGGQQNGINNNQSRGGPHRSPIMNHSQPGQFNPASGAFSPASGPNIRPPRQSNQQQMGGRGMYAPQGMPGQHYPGMAQAFSPYGQGPYNAYEFNPAFQYQQQQHYPGQPGGPSVQSPSMGRPPLHNAHSGSFGSNTSGLPPVTGGVASPMSPQLAPGTPQQAPRTPSLFSPGAAAFSPGASAFTPGGGPPAFVPAKARASAVKITRDDGTAVDLSIVAKTVKGSGPTAAAIAAAASIAATASPKPTGAVPVTVRIESPVQKELRQRELDEEKKRKEQDAREERERKERKEKKEKDDQQREQKQAEEKKADDKVQADKETKQAEAEADKKVADAAAEKKASEDATVAAEKKAADDKASADAEKKATADAAEKKQQEEKQAAESAKDQPEPAASVSVSEAPSNSSTIAGLPPKPSTEVLEKANLSAPDVSGRASATPSPMASPAMAHATLPAKPELASSEHAPASQQNGVSLSTETDSPAFGLALKTAKVIEDLRAITYSNGINPPIPELNEHAPAGKYRYDREFLLQFGNVCKDRVPVEIDLHSLGIDPRTAPKVEFTRGGSQRGTPRGQGGARGGPGNMAGGGMGTFGRGAMGSGAMGPIGGGGSYNSRPAQTSEERLARSNTGIGAAFGAARNSQGGMSRTTSQAGPMGSMQGGMRNTGDRARSTRGKPRGGEGRQPFQAPLDPNVAPLEASANRWTPAVQSRRPGQLDENSPEFVERKVKGLLNKLTAEKFDSISNQILEWANKSVTETDGQTLRLVIKLIFEKAKDEQFWSSMYAKLCRKLWQDINPDVQDAEMTGADGKPLSGGLLFRKYLLNRCQEDFEKGWKQKADASAAAKEKAADDQLKKAAHDAAVEAGNEVEEFKFSDEYYAEQAAKRQGLGLVKFVGELFKLEMLSTRVIHACIVKLLANVVDPDEEDVESLCQLLTTVGAKLEAQPKMSQQVGLYMQRMDDLRNSEHLSSRIRFMVQDVMELQRNKWQERNAKGPTGAMTIDQVHAQARQEAEASRIATASAMSRNESRGGSRRGQDRGGYGGHGGGGDNWTNVSNKLPAKPADMSAFGKIQAGAGPTSFGPNSIFGKKKGGKASGDTTPPLISRTPSSNMFSALEGHDNAADPASPPTDGAPQQRKRLQLQPRTVDLDQPSTESVEQETADDGTGADAAAEAGNSDELSEEAIDRKIKNDVEELWGLKDIGGTRKPSDIVEYFESLPESARVKLGKKLVDDVFRIAKQKDTDVVVEGFKLAVESDVFTAEQAKDALMPSVELLDDLSVDIPLAYDFTAQLMAAVKLPQAEVEALGDAIESFGEPKITPKDKLLRSFEKISASAE